MSAPVSTRLALASDPAPSAIARGPVARLHFRHDVATNAALAAVVAPDGVSAEFPALLAECHARLLDPSGCTDLARPSPVGVAVGAAMTASARWESLCDAAALHPSIACSTSVALAPHVLAALGAAGIASTDTRRAIGDLEAARARLEAARARAASAPRGTPEHREALKESVEAGAAERAAHSAAQAADAAGARVADAMQDGALAHVVDGLAAAAEEKADAVRAFHASGAGTAMGAHDAASIPDDVVALLTPHVAAMLRAVGALRFALRAGRASRHLPGREGCLGPDVGGLDRVGDLTPLARAALAGVLGAPLAALERLRLVEGRSAVVEKGGGKANDGDVVVVLDQSGSMEGDRAVWANALALAVVLEARAAGRTASVVTFSGAVRASVVVDSPARMRLAMLAILSAPSGGTALRTAMTEAHACLGRMRKGGEPADVLLITDGDWKADALADWTASDAKRARLRAVFVGGSAPDGVAFASSWSITAGTTADAVAIARTIV